MAASSSTENKSSVQIKEKNMRYYLYPPPIAQYEDVIASPKLFMDILGKFHAAMGTKFKIPIVGGRDLDLHRLFMEVTSRGGIKRVLEEKKWREVTNCFCFPPSATNASFILRKYYMSLVHHFEQVYYFKAKTWTPVPTDTWQSTKTTLTSTSGMNNALLPLPELQMNQSPDIQATSLKRQRIITEEDSLPKGSPESSIGLPVTGVIDGKFESGYLCTVRIGGEQLQGVLYQTLVCDIPKQEGVVTMDGTQGLTMVRRRRRRRKKSEIRKRDPAHPKPNRSGYNFFFAEHHARLKLLHTGKDRAISRMIGEEWNKLTESEKAVYQEKAAKDKERYRSEMEHYREGFKRAQVLTTSMPLQQQYFMMDTNMENNVGNSHRVQENELNSGCGDDDDSSSSSFEGEEKTTGNDSNLEMGTENVDMETVAGEKDLLFGEQKNSFVNQDNQSVFPDEFVEQKTISIQEVERLIIEKQDGKSPDIDPMIPGINVEKNSKSTDNQEQDLVRSDAIVENENRLLLVINENRELENQVSFQEKEGVMSDEKIGQYTKNEQSPNGNE